MMAQAADLHPISRACMGFHLWSFAGLGQHGDRMEAAVTAARIATSEGKGAIFAPLAMGGAGGLRAGGTAADRLVRWFDGMETCKPDRDAAPRRHRGLVSAVRNRDGHALGQDTPGLARGADRMAARLRPDGRGADRRQPRRRPAQPRLDGDAGSNPRGDGAGAVSDVAGSSPTARAIS